MSITVKLSYNRRQIKAFARVFRQSRSDLGLSQKKVALAAFGYTLSHSKVGRIENAKMKRVDAFAIDRMAKALQVPKIVIQAIDDKFDERLAVTRFAGLKGFWDHPAVHVEVPAQLPLVTLAEVVSRPASQLA